MRRREPVTFVESVVDVERKAFCRVCEETTGHLNRLVPRFEDGLRDDKFKVCCFCGKVYPILDIKLFTEYEPKGYVLDNPFEPGIKVSVTNNRRIIKKQEVRVIDEDVEIPRLAEEADTELESMLRYRVGIINYVNDGDDDILDD